ncbi:hypothetical protein TFKS16_2097 [Tannerella forsythia KS16]|uniref:Uncharacterized protein n=1 Tax=Tannerella forsythia (strain ATCC 43037 / JCM 10827 / CCUG 21028 A / KCTC 5666 / FDC 338) TaxID=203275 RepID=G8UJY1_TANFA|nr:hypothetical protein BFO_2303 [Tannerella forsythia 92A2]BAR52306.1 hypothetical protein TFKS16_2097 [Tannerella forsythia KS16]
MFLRSNGLLLATIAEIIQKVLPVKWSEKLWEGALVALQQVL